jgi:heptosyltransferase-3
MPADPIPLNDLRRVLVIKLRHHGDVLLASPVFSVLKRHAPQAEIDALVYADTAPMLTLHPAIARVHGIDRNWKKLGAFARLSAELALFNRLRERRYDLVVHLTEHPRGAWLARLLGAPCSVAPRVAGKPKFWRNSFTCLYAQPGNARRHMVERNLDALRRIGIQPGADERRLTLVPGREAETRVADLLAQHGLAGKDFIHFHPASRWLFKCWSIERNAELVCALLDAGKRIVLTAAPDARESEFVKAILVRAGNAVTNLSGQLSLKELAALTERAALFVGVDSAPMHIAAAMGTPVVALFGPSGELEWGPWGVTSRVITSEAHPCRPCGIDGCGGSKVSECLTTLPVARVMAAIGELLALAPPPARGSGE